jgi:predicted metal-dependent TIM-barrel fold hydrolase
MKTADMSRTDTLFVDSHVHLDRILAENSERIAWLKNMGCLPISWAFGEDIETVEDLRNYLRAKQEAIHQISSSGLSCYYLAGIHPRNIPSDLRPEAIEDILGPYLDDPLCLGIGEIGLETGSNRAKKVLSAQLDMAHEVTDKGKVFGIHSPRENKTQIIAEILAILEQFGVYHNSIVVDHCTIETIRKVLDMGFWAGVTISPIKTSVEELRKILNENPNYHDRIMLNTDSGSIFYEDLYSFYLSEHISEDIKTNLVKRNALSFFKEALAAFNHT